MDRLRLSDASQVFSSQPMGSALYPQSCLRLRSPVPVSSFQRNRKTASLYKLPATPPSHIFMIWEGTGAGGTWERKLPAVQTCSLTHCPVRDFPVLSSLTFRTSLGGKYCYLFSDKDPEIEGHVAHMR